MRSSRYVVLIGLLAAARPVAGQDIRKWTFSAGPAVAATPPRESFDASLGVAVSAANLQFDRSDVALGVEVGATILPVRMGGERVCVVVCNDVLNPRVVFATGVGFAAQFGPARANGVHPFARAHVMPSVVGSSRRGEDGVDLSFTPAVGVTAGLARGRSRFAFGLDILPSIDGKAPVVWTVMFGIER